VKSKDATLALMHSRQRISRRCGLSETRVIALHPRCSTRGHDRWGNRHTEIKVRSLEALPLVDGVAAVGLVAVVPAPEPGTGETVGEELQGQAWARDVVSVNDHAWGVHVAGLDACCHWNQVVARAPPCQRFRVHFR